MDFPSSLTDSTHSSSPYSSSATSPQLSTLVYLHLIHNSVWTCCFPSLQTLHYRHHFFPTYFLTNSCPPTSSISALASYFPGNSFQCFAITSNTLSFPSTILPPLFILFILHSFSSQASPKQFGTSITLPLICLTVLFLNSFFSFMIAIFTSFLALL